MTLNNVFSCFKAKYGIFNATKIYNKNIKCANFSLKIVSECILRNGTKSFP